MAYAWGQRRRQEMPHLCISHQSSTLWSRRGRGGPAGLDPPQCSLLHSPCPGYQASEDPSSSQTASVPARAAGLGQGSGDSYKNNNLPCQLPGLLTRPTAISVGWPLCLVKVPSSPGRLASPGSRCWWLGLGAKRSFQVTSGPCTVDNMLCGAQQGLNLSDTRGPPFSGSEAS